MSEESVHLLTKEYSLALATTQEDFQAVKELRNDIISHNYPELEHKEVRPYLFSQDDEQSFIYLLQHQATKTYVGTVRVFFINGHTPIQKTPMQKDFHIKNIEYFTQNIPICEISRFGLSNKLIEHRDFSGIQLRTHLSIALMIATRINFFLYHYFTVFSIMERSLDRILKRQGVRFQQIAEPIDYYGIRTPFAIERKKLLRDTENSMGKITRFYLKELCKNPKKFWQFIDNNPYLERSDIQLDRICKLFEAYGDDVDLELLLGEKEVITGA